jgi:lysozyme
VLALSVLPAALAAYGWFWWLPGFRPQLDRGETYGIDVSNHQGAIAWDRVAGDRISFAYVKASEGPDFVDARFADNWAVE